MNIQGLELDKDLADLYAKGMVYENPAAVLADRAIQVQQLRLLSTTVAGLAEVVKGLQALAAALPKSDTPPKAAEAADAPALEPTTK